MKDNTFSSDVTAPNSAKVTGLIDHMLKNGSLTQDSIFGSSFVAKVDHLVAIPGPAWYAGALFQNPASINAKPGQWGASAPLTWSSGDKVTGNVGGGVYVPRATPPTPMRLAPFSNSSSPTRRRRAPAGCRPIRTRLTNG